MKMELLVAFAPLLLSLGSMGALGQEPIPVTKNYVAWAHEFLRTMYPHLSGNRYILSLEAVDRFDDPRFILQPDLLYVGYGAEYEIIGMYGGVIGSPCMSPVIGSPGIHGGVTGSPVRKPSRQELEGVQPGPLHHDQVLKAIFRFDDHDHLTTFSAEGIAIGNREALWGVTQQIRQHPLMTDSEIFAALKKAGAKYGPNDKELILKDFPFARLERFLGRLRIGSADYLAPRQGGIITENNSWTVTAQATQRDGSVITYKLEFEQFKGDLVSCVADGDR
jgi:hypothetical protein